MFSLFGEWWQPSSCHTFWLAGPLYGPLMASRYSTVDDESFPNHYSSLLMHTHTTSLRAMLSIEQPLGISDNSWSEIWKKHCSDWVSSPGWLGSPSSPYFYWGTSVETSVSSVSVDWGRGEGWDLGPQGLLHHSRLSPHRSSSVPPQGHLGLWSPGLTAGSRGSSVRGTELWVWGIAMRCEKEGSCSEATKVEPEVCFQPWKLCRDAWGSCGA